MKTNELTIEAVLKQRYSNVSKPTHISIDDNKVKHGMWNAVIPFNKSNISVGVFTYDNFTTQQEMNTAEFTRFCSYGGFTYTF